MAVKSNKTPHRSYHVLDVANEIRSGRYSSQDVLQLRKAWVATTRPAEGDQYYAATGPGTKAELAFGWPEAFREVGHGPDGADFKIISQLADVDYISSRFDHVYLGTGDHKMAEPARALIEAGVSVTLVARRGSVHKAYRDIPGLKILYLDEQWVLAA